MCYIKLVPIQAHLDFCVFSHSNKERFHVRRIFLRACITNATEFQHTFTVALQPSKVYDTKIHMECILVSIIHLQSLQLLCDHLINATFMLYEANKEAQNVI